MTKWHGSEEGAQRHRRWDFWRPLGDILGSILGAFWGPFGHIWGVRSALGRKCLIKGGGPKLDSSFFFNLKKNENFGTRKREPNWSQEGTEKGKKKRHLKKWDVHIFLNKFEENVVFYRGKWPSRADSIIFYNEFARPEGQENRRQCGQNLGKTMIFVKFCGVS